MSRFPHAGEVLGAQPANPLLAPVLSAAGPLDRSPQRAMLDLQAIQRIPGLAGYWPADPAYLFEDSAGTIPANTNGTGVVGLLLDIRRGLAIGPDLVDTANLATAWTPYGNNVIEQDGDAVKVTYVDSLPGGYVSLSDFKGITQNLVVGNRLVITGEVAIVSGSATLLSAGGMISPIINITESSFTPFSFTTTVYGVPPYLRIDYSVGGVAKIRNIAVRLVLGNHAVQNTTANKPYLRKTPTSGVHWLDSNTSTSALTATLGNLGNSCTVARSGAEGVTFTEGVTISSTYNIAPAYGFNGDIAIFDRALTVTEKALLTRYMQRGVPLLGSNLVTNGTFEDETGWGYSNTGSGTATITGGVGSMTGIDLSNRGRIIRSTPYVPYSTGKQVLFTFDVVSGSVSMQVGLANVGGSSIDIYGSLANRSYSVAMQVATRISESAPSFNVYGNGTRTIDNVAIKEIL